MKIIHYSVALLGCMWGVAFGQISVQPPTPPSDGQMKAFTSNRQDGDTIEQPTELLPPGVNAPNAELTLAELEQLAIANNPALAQAEARVRALRGRWVQVGLPPNPSAGYIASEIGDEGKAGQQGGYVGQEFVTGGKLRLNRAIVSQEIQQAEQQLAAMQLRVQTDVREAYYAALIAQRRVDLASELLRVSGEADGSSIAIDRTCRLLGPATTQGSP